jgi:hypothetical protein
LSLALAVALVLLADVASSAEQFSQRKFFDDLKKGKAVRLTYDFYVAGKKIGSLSSDVSKNPVKERARNEFLLRSKLNLDFGPIGANRTFLATEQSSIDATGKIQDYAFDTVADGQETHITAKVFDDSVKGHVVTGDAQYKKEIKMAGKPFFIIDNNMIDHWFLLFMMLNCEAEKNYVIEAFFPQSMLNMTMNIRYLGREDLKTTAGKSEGLVYYVDEVSEIMSVTQRGLLVRIEDPVQKLVINLSRLETSDKAGDK